MKQQAKDRVKTVLTTSIALTVLYWITGWNRIIPVAVAVVLACIFSSYFSKKTGVFWRKLSLLIGFIVSNILLSIIFFLLLFPTALLSRTFGKNAPLNMKNRIGSNFKNSSKTFDKNSFEKLW